MRDIPAKAESLSLNGSSNIEIDDVFAIYTISGGKKVFRFVIGTTVCLPFLLSLTLWVNPCVAADLEPKKMLGEEIFERIQKATYRIKTSTQARAAKVSYGTGFAVDSHGLLITNYHVISSALLKSKQYDAFVVINEQSYPVQVLAFSVLHDLAVLKVEHELPDVLSLAERDPKIGERIFSIGIPEDLNMSLIEGVYNGVITKGPYQEIHMSAPLNRGMSGGPTVNSFGEVVGVNVSTQFRANDISFAVPIKFGKLLLSNKLPEEGPYRELTATHAEIGVQLGAIQTSLSERWSTSDSAEKLELGKWKVFLPDSDLKCWSKKDRDPADRFEILEHSCDLGAQAFVEENASVGSYSISYSVLTNKSLSAWQLYPWIDSYWAKQNWYLYYFSRSDEESLTKRECGTRIVRGANNVNLLVSFCMRGYIDYSDLYNFELRFVALDHWNDTLVFNAELSAFKLEQFEAFLNIIIKGASRVEE